MRVEPPAGLCGHVEGLLALATQARQQALAVTVAVDVGCVEEVDSEVERAVKRGQRLRRLSCPRCSPIAQAPKSMVVMLSCRPSARYFMEPARLAQVRRKNSRRKDCGNGTMEMDQGVLQDALPRDGDLAAEAPFVGDEENGEPGFDGQGRHTQGGKVAGPHVPSRGELRDFSLFAFVRHFGQLTARIAGYTLVCRRQRDVSSERRAVTVDVPRQPVTDFSA